MSINQIQSVFLLRVQKIGVDIAENEPPKVLPNGVPNQELRPSFHQFFGPASGFSGKTEFTASVLYGLNLFESDIHLESGMT